MESNITIDITRFRSLLESKKAKGQNLQPALEKIGMDLEKETQLNFKRKKDPDGMPWKELAPSTKKSKIKRGRNPNNILRDKSLMFNSIHNVVGENFALVAPGKEIKQARIIQNGGDIKVKSHKKSMFFKVSKTGMKLVKRKKSNFEMFANVDEYIIHMPQRKFIGITEKMKKRYMKIIMDYLKED